MAGWTRSWYISLLLFFLPRGSISASRQTICISALPGPSSVPLLRLPPCVAPPPVPFPVSASALPPTLPPPLFYFSSGRRVPLTPPRLYGGPRTRLPPDLPPLLLLPTPHAQSFRAVSTPCPPSRRSRSPSRAAASIAPLFATGSSLRFSCSSSDSPLAFCRLRMPGEYGLALRPRK